MFEFIIVDTSGINEAYALLQFANEKLHQKIKHSWRWEILNLKSIIDYELYNNHSQPTARCDDAFERLIQLYHAENSIWVVKPPSSRLKPKFGWS